MLLFFVRHGDPIYDPDSLTPLGERQAEAVAKRFAVHGIDKIYASTSTRAYQTAVPTAEILKKEITEIDYFNEKYAWDYFAFRDGEGRHRWCDAHAGMRQKFVSREIYALGEKWYEHPDFKETKFKEGMEYFAPKIDDFMRELGYAHDRETCTYRALAPKYDRVAIFAHGGFGSVFLSQVLDIPYPIIVSHFHLTHSGVTVIDFKGDGEGIVPTVLQFGGDGHIYKEGLPLYHNNVIPM